MKTMFRYAVAIPAALAFLLFTGCEQAEESYPVDDSASWEADTWQDPATQAEEPVIVDTHYTVVEKRQGGGEIYEDSSDISPMDGKPRKKRTPQRFVILTRGNNTGESAAYELPMGDFNIVQVGHNLQKSTLARWEKVSGEQIPPAQEPKTREAGERPYQVMDSGHIAF